MKIDGKELLPRPDLGFFINFTDKDLHRLHITKLGSWEGPPSSAHRRFLKRAAR